MDQLNMARRHRHGEAWQRSQNRSAPTRRDLWVLRWILVGCVMFWAALIWLLVHYA